MCLKVAYNGSEKVNTLFLNWTSNGLDLNAGNSKDQSIKVFKNLRHFK